MLRVFSGFLPISPQGGLTSVFQMGKLKKMGLRTTGPQNLQSWVSVPGFSFLKSVPPTTSQVPSQAKFSQENRTSSRGVEPRHVGAGRTTEELGERRAGSPHWGWEIGKHRNRRICTQCTRVARWVGAIGNGAAEHGSHVCQWTERSFPPGFYPGVQLQLLQGGVATRH